MTKKIFLLSIILLINTHAEAVVWNLKGFIRITNTPARNIVLNYLSNKSSNYVLLDLNYVGVGNKVNFTEDTVIFSIRTANKSIRDEMRDFIADKINTYSAYIGTGSAIYRHICYNDMPAGQSQPCVDELLWSK